MRAHQLKHLFALMALVVTMGLNGCVSSEYAEVNPRSPFVFPTEPTPPAAAPLPDSGRIPPATTPVYTPQTPVNTGHAADNSNALHVGDLITVTFSDVPPNTMPEHKERIREDGNITLPLNVTVQAVGRTPGQLQDAIRNAYVPKYFKLLTVTVKTEDRFYFVGGEVRIPNRYQYGGEMTVLRAVDTAGGFTDFANRNNIEVRRANGEKLKVKYDKVIQGKVPDPPVYPNDQVIVHKKGLFN